MTTLADAAMMLSIAKPLILVAALIGWARWVALLDKDAEYFYLPRTALNALNLVGGAAAFAAALLVPIFWLGLPLAILIVAATSLAYVTVRHKSVPESDRWTLNADFFRQLVAQRRQEASERSLRLRFVSNSNPASPPDAAVPVQDSPHYAPHAAWDDLLAEAVRRHAQRIEIEAGRENVRTQFHIDGVPFKGEPMEPAEAVAAIDYLKRQAGLDPEDRRRRQVGTVRVSLESYGEHDLRLTTAGSTRGLICSIEIDPRKQRSIGFKKLGLLESQAAQLQPVLDDAEGLVVVAAPPGQGRTTTLYALLQQHDPYLTDIHTIEPRIELDLEGVTQHEQRENDWSKPLGSLLLREPAIVMLAQVPDKETAKLASDAANDGKRIYLGVKGDDAFAALRAYAGAVGDVQTASRGLRAVIAQRLVRKLCPVCRQAYQPDAAALKKLNVPADRVSQLYKASGQVANNDKPETCPTCLGIGYLGRAAAFEVMVFDEEARRLLAAGDTNGLRTHLRKQKMLWLQEAALAQVVNGQTSISEVMRVLGGDKQTKPAARNRASSSSNP